MKPKIKDQLAWEQAQLLMQPAFIRILDNIRKQLEESDWQGTFQEIQTPYPGYLLSLTRQDRSIDIDLWELCFEVCFLDYQSDRMDSPEVDIDTSLIDETGDVDWQLLETKAQNTVKKVFDNLDNLAE
jgi:hypothetical protein